MSVTGGHRHQLDNNQQRIRGYRKWMVLIILVFFLNSILFNKPFLALFKHMKITIHLQENKESKTYKSKT